MNVTDWKRAMLVDPRAPEMRRIKRRKIEHRAPAGQDVFAFAKPRKVTAAEVIERHLLAVLPAGVPPSFQSITDAQFTGLGRSRIAAATVLLVDGETVGVEVFGWTAGLMGHRWTNWSGPALYFEGGQWRRDTGIAV